MTQGPGAAVPLACRPWPAGSRKVYVELQNHGIDLEHPTTPGVTDDEVVDGLWEVARPPACR